MKLYCGDERARWGPAACPGRARASERERASLTDGRCNPAIVPDAADQSVLTTPTTRPLGRTRSRQAGVGSAGSGSGRLGANDGEVPGATREIQCPNNQEEGCPCVDAVREAYDARGDRDTATGNTPGPKEAEMAVLKWPDQAPHAGAWGRCPPPA